MTEELETEKKKNLPEHNKVPEIKQPEKVDEIEHKEVKELEGPERIKDLEERLLRLAADFENFKKRAEKEHGRIRETSNASLILKILAIMDEFEIALKHDGGKEFKKGVEMIYDKMIAILKEEEVEEMKDKEFDPHRHEAVRQADGENGRIMEIIQKGYLLRGRVLRHAKVVVGKKGDEK
ncbi:nucleotide exchange factor GrpE [Candidatus Micrarchaeota archaeon]|nr:nucleotide exchange factor GrpE [Candidatus Micrarchaeota archaeon]